MISGGKVLVNRVLLNLLFLVSISTSSILAKSSRALLEDEFNNISNSSSVLKGETEEWLLLESIRTMEDVVIGLCVWPDGGEGFSWTYSNS